MFPLYDLNPRQRQAVTTIDGPLAVIAGPGTGKTRTIAHRAAYLLQDHAIPPQNILCLTFTRAAAAEMRERIRALLPPRTAEATMAPLWVETFHAAALRILKEQEAFRKAKLDQLRKDIMIGIEQSERGESKEFNLKEFLAEAHRRYPEQGTKK